MRIGLIPLDERPANTRYPAMTAAIAGAELVLPPAELLSAGRRPADCVALGAWLAAVAPGLDALIVSVEQLGYGGLVASRITDEPAATLLAHLEPLRALRRAHPALAIYGFNVVTRVSNADDAAEEPAYWAEHGAQLYAFSQLLDKQRQGHAVADELARLEAAVPAALRRDFLARRLRNHAVNLAVLGLLEDATLDLLVLASDDTSPFGLPAAERGWLGLWAELLGRKGDQGPKTKGQGLPVAVSPGFGNAQRHGIGPSSLVLGPLLMYPGADEVACVLVARLLNARAGVRPTIAVSYAPPECAANVAAYEDGPISRTVERQIVAAGCAPWSGAPPLPRSPVRPLPDLWLGVSAPVARRGEWEPELAAAEAAPRLPALRELVAAARAQLAAGRAVALADVAYPNGADPALSALLVDGLELPALAAYGAWNTAGNSVGAVLAQACAAQLIAAPAGRAAHERLLLHRLLEDWGYQRVVRAELRAWLRETTGHHDPQGPAMIATTVARAEAGLSAFLDRLPGFAGRYRIMPGSVRLPWGRSFEVDFELEAVPHHA